MTRPVLKSIKYICKAQTLSYSGYSWLFEYVTFMKIGCYFTFAFSFSTDVVRKNHHLSAKTVAAIALPVTFFQYWTVP